MLKLARLSIGYMSVNPVRNGKNVVRYVHRLVAAAFLGPCPPGLEVNHKDGNPENNRLSNLEYVTHAENMRHAAQQRAMAHGSGHPSAKLTEANVRRMRELQSCGVSYSKLCAMFGVSIATAWNAVNRVTWRHVQ